jgi:putative Holliday junction resolvase
MQNTYHILMAFDFGMRRIGVAIGQTITATARPLTTLLAKEGEPNWDELATLIKKWAPNALIIGIPLNMDGTEQPITLKARQFAAKLHTRYQLPVHNMDERLTTKAARENLFTEGGFKALQDGQVDQVAAQLILQHWFAENNHG